MKKMYVKMSAKWLPFCTGLNVLKCASDVSCFRMTYYTPPASTKLKVGGILVDTRSQGISMHTIVLVIPPHNEVGGGGGIMVSLRPSVRLSRISCPLCSAYSSGWIHFIFIHLIQQLQKVCWV